MDAECAGYITPRPWVYLDVGGGGDNALLLWMQWNNQLLDNADESSGRVNTHNFYIEKYKLSFTGPVPIPDIAVEALAPPVPAEGTATGIVTAIPIPITQYLKTALPVSGEPVLVVVDVIASGRLGDDSAYETGSFKIPVDVYNTTFPGFTCPPGEVVTAVCPNDGQTASVNCEAVTP